MSCGKEGRSQGREGKEGAKEGRKECLGAVSEGRKERAKEGKEGARAGEGRRERPRRPCIVPGQRRLPALGGTAGPGSPSFPTLLICGVTSGPCQARALGLCQALAVSQKWLFVFVAAVPELCLLKSSCQ